MRKTKCMIAAWTVILSLLMTLTAFLPIHAGEEIDTSRQCTMALKFHGETQKDPAVNVKVHIYQVASIDSDGSYTRTGKFAKLPIELSNEQSSSEWVDLAGTLKAYTSTEQIPVLSESITDETGLASFQNLSVGLYLVVADNWQEAVNVYSYSPVLIAMPYTNPKDGTLVYDSLSSPIEMKSEEHSDVSQYAVVKHWDDAGAENRPDSISVNLVKNGIVDSTVTLNDENNWTWSWYDFNPLNVWEVTEADVPEGYTVSVSSGSSDLITIFTITNTNTTPRPEVPTTPDDLPFTGQYWLPVMILATGGVVLLTAGAWMMHAHE